LKALEQKEAEKKTKKRDLNEWKAADPRAVEEKCMTPFLGLNTL
jgi:hypothetical protein